MFPRRVLTRLPVTPTLLQRVPRVYTSLPQYVPAHTSLPRHVPVRFSAVRRWPTPPSPLRVRPGYRTPLVPPPGPPRQNLSSRHLLQPRRAPARSWTDRRRRPTPSRLRPTPPRLLCMHLTQLGPLTPSRGFRMASPVFLAPHLDRLIF